MFHDTTSAGSFTFDAFDTRLGTLNGVSADFFIGQADDFLVTPDTIPGAVTTLYVANVVHASFAVGGSTASNFIDGPQGRTEVSGAPFTYHDAYGLSATALPKPLPIGDFLGSAITASYSYYASTGMNVAFGRIERLTHNDPNAVFSLTYSYDAAVPEPATWALLITGFGLVGARSRRRAATLA